MIEDPGWWTAFGTIFLGCMTFVVHIIGDSYTRLTKAKYGYEFKKIAYNFLATSLASWGMKMNSLGHEKKTSVEENINNFRKEILDNKIYLSWCNIRKLNKYFFLAKKLALAWDDQDDNKIEKNMRKVAKEMEKLSLCIGNESNIQELRNKYPWLFDKNAI